MGASMRISCVRAAVALALLAALPHAADAAEPESLERGFVAKAPGLIKQFKAKGYKNVGVLKFLVLREGAKTFSDNVGTLNMTLARRLEVALVLANDPRAPVGVVRNASAVAARTAGANHLTKAGRVKLFAADYPLAWGKDEVKADAFATGTAMIGKDLKTMTVSLLVFDREGGKVEQFGEDFLARNDAGKLAEMGESFVLRGLFDDGEAVATAAKVAAKEVVHPLAAKAATAPPVVLDLFYDDERVALEARDGRLYAPEPSEGQKVAFRLTRDKSKTRYGVVLKVNGENTIEKQREPDLYCRRWVLGAGLGPVGVSAFQMSDTKFREFKVLSAAAAKAREVNYGADVGTITLTVFREGTGEEVVDTDRASRNSRLVAKAHLPAKTPDNYDALKAQLLADADRGLIVDGEEKEGAKVKRVKFKADPTPVMSATIIYYKP